MRPSPTRRMWTAMGTERRELALAGIVGMLASLSAVALLGTSAWLISRAAEAPPVLTLTVAAVMVRAFALGRAVLRYVDRLIGHDAAFRGLTALRVAVYDRLEVLAPVGLARFARGDLLNRLVADVDAALDLPLRVVLPWVQAALVSAATVAFCVWLVPDAGIVIGIVAVIALTLSPIAVARLAAGVERAVAPTRAVLSERVVIALDASPDLLVYGRVPDAQRSIDDVDASLTSLARRSAFALGFGGGTTTFLQGIAVVGALTLSIPRVVDGALEPVWLAVIALVPLALFEVTGVLPSAALALNRVRGSADRLAAVEDQPDPVTRPASPRLIPPGFSGMELDRVGARWSGDDAVLHDISLAIAPGERVWIVGPSGSGKSTLAAVLLGFLDYTGSMRINGIEARETDGDDQRERIGLLDQRAHVFDTTIGQNITLGRVAEDDPSVRAAVDGARLRSLVDALPQGLDTMVGAFGAAVSGGEAQRIAIARLLVEPRPVLVLDEPTAHLDALTSAELDVTLRHVADATTIVITHRLSDIGAGERVIVLDEGRVAAMGTVDEVERRSPWFAGVLRDEQERMRMAHLLTALPVGVAVPRSELPDLDGPASMMEP